MKQQSGKSRKPLVIGVIAAVLILALALVLVLVLWGGGKEEAAATEPSGTTAPAQTDTYDLYWNVDRAEYDGKSEGGMSSRKQEADGYFHVRFFKDGQMLELRVADRKVVNKIEANDLMGLEFDENGIVIDVIPADQLPLQRVGWRFYVQSVGGNKLKLNSSKKLDGMEVLLDVLDTTHIYDMTGVEGEIGMEIMPTNLDRVIAIANLDGELTHVFVVDRSEYMNSFEAACQHCGETVTWSQWTKNNELPTISGHYQLQNDVKLTGQINQAADSKICLDLNGKRVDGSDGNRCYAMFNSGCQLAIMDTSQEQTGTIAAHGRGDQGMVVWVRYGACYLYSGTLDGSDAENVIYGTTVAVQENAYMYMYGGTIKGGKAACVYDEKTKTYKRGLGGTMGLAGKFVLHDGLICDGYAEAMISYDAKGQPVYNRGIGGNIYVTNTGVLEINGGTIKNGKADGIGGNIYLDGAADMTMNGGVISGGAIKGRGKNGGSVYVGGKATLTMNGGSIIGGSSRNEGGCVYAGGTFQMNGGYIGGGKVYNYSTGKLKEDCASRNVFVVNSKFSMYGGKIDGGVHAIDTSATDNKTTIVALGGYAVIDGGESKNNLTLNAAGGGVKLYAGNMLDGSLVRVNTSTGIFSQPTKETNVDNFVSDVPGAEVLYYDGRLALGKLGCLCGQESHIGQCDGTQLLWLPHTKTNTLPTTSGYWFLTSDVNLAGQQALKGDKSVVLDLNGKTVTGGGRGFLIQEGASLRLTDSVGGGVLQTKGYSKDSGAVIVVNDGIAEIYGGTLRQIVDENIAVSGAGVIRVDANGTLNLYNGTLVGGEVTSAGGAIRTNGTVNIYGGTVTGGEAAYGGSICINAGTVTICGGTIEKGKATNGGNIFVSKGASLILKEDGKAETVPTITSGEMALASGNGGNIFAEAGSTLTMECGIIENGKALRDSSGNIYIQGTMTMSGGVIRGGYRDNGASENKRNLFAVNGSVILSGGEIAGGAAFYGAKSSLTVSKDARIVSDEVGKPSLTLFAGALVTVDGTLSEKAAIVVSNSADTQLTVNGTSADKARITSDKELAVSLEADGTIWLREHTHCSENCGGVNGSHAEGCTGFDEGWKVWDGSAITESGNYCLADTVSVSGQTFLENGLEVTLCLNGNTYTSAIRGFLVRGGATLNIVDCVGGGVLEAKGFDKDSGAVIVVADGTVNLYGGTLRQVVDENVSVSGGGVIRVDANGILNIYDGTISGGKVTGVGGNIRTNGTVNIYGGTITGGEAVYGGSIGVNAGTVTVYGGTIEKGKATNGGNIYLGKGASLILKEDGKAETVPTITSGEMALASGNGGNIFADTGSTLTMECGVIENGKALRDSAGNIYLKGAMTMSGGTVSGGHRNNGGSLDKRNIFSVNGQLTVTGGTICGGVCAYGTGGSLKLGSDARIVSDEADKPSLTLSAGALITIEGALTEKASIVLSNAADTRITTGGTDEDKARITSDKGLKVTLEADGMYLRAADAHVHCLCGRTDGTHAEGCDGKDVFFTAWTATDSLPDNGAYYLAGEAVTLNKQHWIGQQSDTVSEHLKLCLNGKTVQAAAGGNERLIMVWTGSRLTLTDCGTTGTVRGGNLVSQAGGNIYVAGTLDLFGGTVTGGRTSNNGGNIYVAGTMNMAGGTVSDGVITKDGAGNLDVRGTLNMSGGLITGGCRTNANGDVVALSYVKRNIFANGATVNLTGGQIDGGVQLYGSTRLTVSGDVKIVSNEEGKPSLTISQAMTIGADGLTEQASIKLSGWAAGTAFAAAAEGLTLTEEMAARFTCDEGYTAKLENNQILFVVE